MASNNAGNVPTLAVAEPEATADGAIGAVIEAFSTANGAGCGG